MVPAATVLDGRWVTRRSPVGAPSRLAVTPNVQSVTAAEDLSRGEFGQAKWCIASLQDPPRSSRSRRSPQHDSTRVRRLLPVDRSFAWPQAGPEVNVVTQSAAHLRPGAVLKRVWDHHTSLQEAPPGALIVHQEWATDV